MMFEYNGYVGAIDPDDGVFTGRVIGLRDVVTFEGASFTEVETAFGKASMTIWRFVRRAARHPTGFTAARFRCGLTRKRTGWQRRGRRPRASVSISGLRGELRRAG